MTDDPYKGKVKIGLQCWNCGKIHNDWQHGHSGLSKCGNCNEIVTTLFLNEVWVDELAMKQRVYREKYGI
jgi:hypothetical protein